MRASTILRWAGLGVLVVSTIQAHAAVVNVSVAGTNALPAVVSETPFGVGSTPIADRNAVVRPADFFEDSGRLRLGAPSQNGTWPSYLTGGQSIMSPQGNRSIVDFSMTITVDEASFAYLLVDNRCDGIIGNSPVDSEYDDPFIFGTIQWIADDGWVRMNTVISPAYNGQPQPDWIGIDEGANGDLNQFYAIYRRVVEGSFTLGAQAEGNNMYHVVVLPVPEPASLTLLLLGSLGLLTLRHR